MLHRIKSSWLRNLRIGYISGQSGIMNRYLNEGENWNSHLEKSKQLITEFILSRKPKTVRILGSGWLLDVPIDAILKTGAKVILTDIIHPRQIKHKYAHNSQVTFETIDLNGGLVFFIGNRKVKQINYFELANFINNSPLNQFNEDIVISLNLLSQLAELPLNFLARKQKLDDWQVEELTEEVQNRHLQNLPTGKTLLITDFEEEYYQDKKLSAVKPTVFVKLEDYKQLAEWDWNFDTLETYKEDYTTILKVKAVEI